MSAGQGGKGAGKAPRGPPSHLAANSGLSFHCPQSVSPPPAPAAPAAPGFLGEEAASSLSSSVRARGAFWRGSAWNAGLLPGRGMLRGPGSDHGSSSAPMEYVSTRGGAGPVDFEGALFSGYAPDGGLFMPRRIPSLDRDTLRRWSRLSYPELVKELCSLFVTAELVPRSTLSGEPQPRGERLAGTRRRIWGLQVPSPHPSTAPRGWSVLQQCLLLSYPVLCHLAGSCYLLEKVSPVCKEGFG